MIATLVLLSLSIPPETSKPDAVRKAVRLAVPQLIAGATGHTEKRSCFSCHNQAFPALALTVAHQRGFELPKDFFSKQAEHIAEFLTENKKEFLAGKGTGGRAATAAYALLTLELAGHKPDETTAAVAQYLLGFEPTYGYWRMTSHRPPTESSHFTTTYVAMRALRTYGSKNDREKFDQRVAAARQWLVNTPGKETEDRVFRLLGLKESGASEKDIAAAAWELIKTQRGDGGWSQLDGGASDPYATGSALVALHEVGGLKSDSGAYRAGVDYLLKTQLPDGTWKVKSRSIPFQPYYESGFPHGKDQFISISASGWATAALLNAMK
jgi:squalene-hopene cyclase-like protein